MLDLHSHVLPGIDDGPRSMEGSMALLRAMVDQGVQHVVATPHIYPGVFDNTAESIRETFDAVVAEMTRADLPLTMSWGAEVRLCSEMLEWLDQGRLPFLGRHADGGHTVLLELPDGQIPVGACGLISRLRSRDVQVLIAHPERNRAICANPELLQPLMDTGARLQLTAASLIGEFGRRAEAAARTLLDQYQDWVAVVASDAHSVRTRPPLLGTARDWLAEHYGLERAEELTERNPARWAGVGQIVFQGRDGTTLRDLDVAPVSSGALADAMSWSLDDLSASSPSRRSLAPSLDVPEAAVAAAGVDTSWVMSLGELPQFAEPVASGSVGALHLTDDILVLAQPHQPPLHMDAETGEPSATASVADAWSLDTVFAETQPAALFISPESAPDAAPAPTSLPEPEVEATEDQSDLLQADEMPPLDLETAVEAAAPCDTSVESVPEELQEPVAAAPAELAQAAALQVNGSTWPRPASGADTWREPKLRLAYQRVDLSVRPSPPVLSDVVEVQETPAAPEPSAQVIELNFSTSGSTPEGVEAVEPAETPALKIQPPLELAADAEAQAAPDLLPDATPAPPEPRGSWWQSLSRPWAARKPPVDPAAPPVLRHDDVPDRTAAAAQAGTPEAEGVDGFQATQIMPPRTSPAPEAALPPAAAAMKPVSAAALGLNLTSIAGKQAKAPAGTAVGTDLTGVTRSARSQSSSTDHSARRGLRLSDIAPLDPSSR